MYEKPFSEFLVEHFISWVDKSCVPGRYQLRSPGFESSLELYNALSKYSRVDSTIQCKGEVLKYIPCQSINVIPVLHNDEEQGEGFTENYISYLRDEVSSQKGFFENTALLVIHNSLLDTLINSADDISKNESVFSPIEIKKKLEDLIDKNDSMDGQRVSKILLDYQFEKIIEDKGSMFGFRALYSAIADGDIRFPEIGLLGDPAILNMTENDDQIRKRLDNNQKLHDQIESVLEHYPDQLEDNMPDFSEKFIKENFKSEDPNKWRDLTYDDIRKEQESNRDQALELVDLSSIFAESSDRTKSDTMPAQRERHVLLVVYENSDIFDLKINLQGAKVSIDQVILKDKSKNLTKDKNLTLRSGSKNTEILIEGSIPGEPLYFDLSLNRPKTSEKFRFKCLVIKEGLFNVGGFKNSYLINPSRQSVVLQTQDTELDIGLNGAGQKLIAEQVGQEFDPLKIGVVDFEALSNEVDSISFSVKNGTQALRFMIEGAAATDQLILPLIFDQSRKNKIFSNDFNGTYNETKIKAYIENREVKSNSGLAYLQMESQLIEAGLVFKDERNKCQLSLGELSGLSVGLHAGYQSLFNYYSSHNTLPSLCGWDDMYCGIVENIVDSYLEYLNSINEKETLDNSHKSILDIGFYKTQDYEFITPFHPLVLAYYLKLVQEVKSDSERSFFSLPKVTLKRLNPQGLLPIIFDAHHHYSHVLAIEENCFWLKCVPQISTNYSYVTKLVNDKVEEFTSAFSILFDVDKDVETLPTLIINSVNNRKNNELFLGIVNQISSQVSRKKQRRFNIHVNIYDDSLIETEFDIFSELASYDAIKNTYGLNKGKNKDNADSVVDLMRKRVSHSKFTHDEDKPQAYAHLTFFRNNEEVKVVSVDPDEKLSGVTCSGLINGEASSVEKNNYLTGFGLRNVNYSGIAHIEIAAKLGRLMKPARDNTADYRDNSAIALAVNSNFKGLLDKSYDSSIWTSIIDPKVTLDFFNNQENTLLIHYSDQYTSSASYDAITVTKQTALYDKVLEKEEAGRIEEFNAFNGEWLLKMITDGKNIRKERKGILTAYKLVLCLLARSSITWVPMSAAEVVRVSGNIGLNMSESEFSRNMQGYKAGAISDDVLFVGFKGDTLYLLPLEVKTGVSYDRKKAVKQAQELGRYLGEEILSGNSLSNKLYRSLFVRQVLMQIDKYELYSVFPEGYFDSFLAEKEYWLVGDYKIGQLSDYAKGFVVANLEDSKCLETTINKVEEINVLEVPSSFIPKTINTPLKDLLESTGSSAIARIQDSYYLTDDYLEDGIPTQGNEGCTVLGQSEIESRSEVSPIEVDPVKPDPTLKDSKALSSLRVKIGTDVKHNEPVCWEYGNPSLPNRHLIIFGRSGQGKTYCIQGLLMDMARNEINSSVIDYTNGFLPDHLESEFLEKVNPKTDLVKHKPLNLDPFKKQTQLIGGMSLSDSDYDVATRISSVFNSVYSTIGEQQIATLIRVIEEGIGLFGGDYNFEKMLSDLSNAEKTGEALANKLLPMVKANIFSCSEGANGWNEIYESDASRNRLIQLAGLSPDVWKLATEFILWDLYSYACANGSKHKPLPIVLDEVQNLDHRLESPLGKMLTEGRKYGLSLLLATQTLSNLKKDEQDRLFQASHKLFFAPAETEIKKYAEILEVTVKGSSRQDWIDVLSALKKGQCLSVGYHLNDGALELSVKKVDVSSLDSRLD